MSVSLCRFRHCLVADMNRFHDRGDGSLDPIERRGQRAAVSAVQLDVIACGIGDVQAHSLSHDEGHGLCFEFARISRLGTITGAVEQLVCLCDPLHTPLMLGRGLCSVGGAGPVASNLIQFPDCGWAGRDDPFTLRDQ
jgi:hypothetical protein